MPNRRGPTSVDVLRHVALYRLTIRRAVDKAFFGGRRDACKSLIDSLVQDALLVPGTLPGQLSYYQLTPAGARKAEERRSLANEVRGDRDLFLSMLWFCFFVHGARRWPVPRHTLERDWFPEKTASFANLHHCLQPASGRHPKACLYRIRYSPRASPAALIRFATKWRDKDVFDDPVLSELASAGRYGLAILTNSQTTAGEVESTIDAKRVALDTNGKRLRIICKYVPGPERIGAELNEREARGKR